MGASGSNCDDEWELSPDQRMRIELSKNRAYLSAKDAILNHKKGAEQKVEYVRRCEEYILKKILRDNSNTRVIV